jgi:hypothetical protein
MKMKRTTKVALLLIVVGLVFLASCKQLVEEKAAEESPEEAELSAGLEELDELEVLMEELNDEIDFEELENLDLE